MMFKEEKIGAFLDVLASKASVPGGGGASALMGAVGASLAQMVGNLTVGKKKYAAVEADVRAIMERCCDLQHAFESLIDEDAVAFEPLSRAYGLPKGTEEEKAARAEIMAKALDAACGVPMKIMRTCCEAIDLLAELGEKGSSLAISDVGVGAVACKAALMGASLNVFINTDLMADRDYALGLEKQADAMLDEYSAKADKTVAAVTARIRKKGGK